MFDLAAPVVPLLRWLPPEAAHGATLWALKAGLGPRQRQPDPPELGVKLGELSFPNPIGMAAGFDKDGEVPDALLRMGFGFTEVGTVTPWPQAGNPKPRAFRLGRDRALINRLGFNNQGLHRIAARLESRRQRGGIVGANVGANRDAHDRIDDYVSCLKRLAPIVDYVVINVSSPNTPGLRELQSRQTLDELVRRVMAARREAVATPQLWLKIAPDLTRAALQDIVQVVLERQIDAVVISNTTTRTREALKSRHGKEEGGLSGAPLFAPSTDMLRTFYRMTAGRVPLVGVGGIASGADAYAKIRAGATLVQLYTALAYQGPGLLKRLKRDLVECLKRDGFGSVAEAVGADAKE